MDTRGPFHAQLLTQGRAIAWDWFTFYQSHLRRNWPGYLREFAPYLTVLVLVAAADFVTTHQFMVEASVEDEAHPGIRLVSRWFGPFLGPLIGKSLQVAALLFLTVLLRPHARKILVPTIVMYGAAASWNHWVTATL